MLKIKLTIQKYYYKKLQKNQKAKLFQTPNKINSFTHLCLILLRWIILLFFGCLIFLPFYFMFVFALMSNNELNDGHIHFYSTANDWSNFTKAFNNQYFKVLGVTIFVTIGATVFRVFLGMLIGYAFSIKKWRFKNLVWWFLISLMLLPEVALLSGQYRIITLINWKNNGFVLLSMFLPFIASVFTVFMYKNAFMAIPDRTREAALIDGLGHWKFFIKIGIPMVKSTTLTVMILTIFGAWNSYSWPSLLLSGANSTNLDVVSTWLFKIGVSDGNLLNNSMVYTNIKMAGAILVIIPMVLVYFIFRKKIMKAISNRGTGIKG